jgi:hypothetical protein
LVGLGPVLGDLKPILGGVSLFWAGREATEIQIDRMPVFIGMPGCLGLCLASFDRPKKSAQTCRHPQEEKNQWWSKSPGLLTTTEPILAANRKFLCRMGFRFSCEAVHASRPMRGYIGGEWASVNPLLHRLWTAYIPKRPPDKFSDVDLAPG